MRRPLLRESLAATAVILALVVVAFGNVVFFGKSLVVSENVNPLDYRYLPGNYGPGFLPLEAWSRRNLFGDPNVRDPAMATSQTEPAAEYLHRSLTRGTFPLWDPYTGGGTPLFASFVPAMLFPPSFLVVLLGNGSIVRNAYMLALIVASGVLTYALLRDRGLRHAPALAGGIAFAFSGAVIETIVTGLGQPTAFFSLPLLATARLFDRPGARRAAEFAAAAAFVALASFPAILLQVFGVCAAYAVAAAVGAPRERRAPSGAWFAAGALAALAIVAVVYVPSFLVVGESPHVSRYYATAALDVLKPRQVMQLLGPTVLGGALVYQNNPIGPSSGQHLYYTGVVALFLAIVGTIARTDARARPLKIAVLATGAFAMAKVFGLPIVQWAAHVPGLRTIHFAAYFGILAAYAIAILAALGVDAIASGRSGRWRVAAAGLAIAAALVFVRLYAATLGVNAHPEGWRWIADFRLLVIFAVAAIGAALAGTGLRARTLALAALATVLAIEGVTNAAYPRQPRWKIWNHPPGYVKAIAAAGTGGRVQPFAVYLSNMPSVFGQPTLDSHTLFTSERMFELYRRFLSQRIAHFLRGASRIPPERVLDAANVEFFTLGSWETVLIDEMQHRGYKTIYRDDLTEVMRRPTAPRYFVTSDYVVMPPGAALEALGDARPGVVILEQRPSFEPSAGAPIVPRVVRFDPNEVELDVDTPRAGLLYCSESLMKGWTATVDGRETPFLHADFAFRAIEVPAGRHRVRLRYRPPGLMAGLLLSAAGVIAMAVGLTRPARRESES